MRTSIHQSLLIIILFFATLVKGQEVHYSQFYALPVTLNPAMTGFADAPYRIAGIYRSQWASFAPFITQSLSAEFMPQLGDPDDPSNTNKLGLGALVTRDQAGVDAGLRTIKMSGSAAYNMDLGPMYLGAGLQAGFVQRTLFGNHTFPDQWSDSDGGIDKAAVSSDHSRIDGTIGYPDVSAGLLTIYKFGEETKNAAHAGVSLYHLLPSNERFISDASYQNLTPMRMVGHIGARVKLSASSPISIVPNLIYMTLPRVRSREINIGGDVEYDFSQINSSYAGIVSGGAYYRVGDAIIVHAAMGVEDFLVGFSYDITASKLSTASNYNGGFELSIRFQPIKNMTIKRLIHQPCPVI